MWQIPAFLLWLALTCSWHLVCNFKWIWAILQISHWPLIPLWQLSRLMLLHCLHWTLVLLRCFPIPRQMQLECLLFAFAVAVMLIQMPPIFFESVIVWPMLYCSPTTFLVSWVPLGQGLSSTMMTYFLTQDPAWQQPNWTRMSFSSKSLDINQLLGGLSDLLDTFVDLQSFPLLYKELPFVGPFVKSWWVVLMTNFTPWLILPVSSGTWSLTIAIGHFPSKSCKVT